MSRVVVLAVVIATLPPACDKLLGKKAPVADDPVATSDPQPVPPPSATTPPIWQQNPVFAPPANSGPVVPAADAPTADLAKAQAAFDAKELKKAKGILEKRVKAGKCIADEVALLTKTCQQLKDKTCVADTKKACPPNATTN